jgi:hypothetical protein
VELGLPGETRQVVSYWVSRQVEALNWARFPSFLWVVDDFGGPCGGRSVGFPGVP